MKNTSLFLLLLTLILPFTGCQKPQVQPTVDLPKEPQVVKLTPLTPDQMGHHKVRVAAVQLNGNWRYNQPYDPANCPADPVLPYIEKAAKDGADLVVFPELLIGMFRVPSPQTLKISQAALTNNIHVIVGCFEVFDEQGHFGNSSLIFNRQEEIVDRYYKYYPAVNVPQKSNDPEALMTPGSEIPVFDLDFGRIGILTCYDGHFPELWRTLSLKGAEIIIWPNARQGVVQPWIVKSNMEQNYVHVVATNKAIGGGTMVAEWIWPPEIKVMSEEGKEDYVIADLDMDQIRWLRANGREFFQRREASAAEMTKRYETWTAYTGAVPIMEQNEPASEQARKELLTNSGISFTEE